MFCSIAGADYILFNGKNSSLLAPIVAEMLIFNMIYKSGISIQMEQRGLQGSCDPTDADWRGFGVQSLCKALSKLELVGLTKRRAIQSSTGAAKNPSGGFG